jgi:predicted RNA-binding protein
MPSPDASALESFDHLKQKVCLMWGSPELDIFISRLLMDSRDGARKGLPVAVGADLLFIAKTNKIIRAIDLMRSQQVTFGDAFRTVDKSDQQRREADELDNPLVSRDTVMRVRKEGQFVARSQALAPKPGGLFGGLGQLMFALLTSKIAILLIFVVLAAILLWPYLN